MRPTSSLPAPSGSAWIALSVSTTASWTGRGRAARLRLARRVSRSSAKPEVALDLVERLQASGGDVLLALGERGHRVLVLEHREALHHGLVLLGGEDDRAGAAVACDHDVLVAALDVVEQLAQTPARFSEGDDSGHEATVQGSVQQRGWWRRGHEVLAGEARVEGEQVAHAAVAAQMRVAGQSSRVSPLVGSSIVTAAGVSGALGSTRS